MHKNILTEQALYYGDVKMPKGFEINQDKLKSQILQSKIENTNFKFSKEWDKLNTFIREHIFLEFKIDLINKSTWGNLYKPSTNTESLLEVNLMDLQHAPDFVLLYGVQVKDCLIKIFYDNNRRKGNCWDIELKNNMFIMFPSINTYTIHNKKNDDLNIIQTITYEYS
jgi:hypothetical protein|tara:strand:+ start:444 stop:947 length:504 start_codon:yes stop_codon:yes gene_type:complete